MCWEKGCKTSNIFTILIKLSYQHTLKSPFQVQELCQDGKCSSLAMPCQINESIRNDGISPSFQNSDNKMCFFWFRYQPWRSPYDWACFRNIRIQLYYKKKMQHCVINNVMKWNEYKQKTPQILLKAWKKAAAIHRQGKKNPLGLLMFKQMVWR